MNIMEKPQLFTTGCKMLLQYRSIHETRRDESKEVVGYVIEDVDDVLVIEEYSNYERINDHRHILFDTLTGDVFSQTDKQTSRIGQVDTARLWAPPWDSRFDVVAGGLMADVVFSKLEIIEEGVYQFCDPLRLGKPDDWEYSEQSVSDPIPGKIVDRNKQTSYSPDIDVDVVERRRPDI